MGKRVYTDKWIVKERNDKITRYLHRSFGTWIMHWHNEMEIVHILDEPAPLIVGNAQYTAHKGDFCIIRGCELHQFLFDKQNKKAAEICKFNLTLAYSLCKKFQYPKTFITKAEIDTVPGLYDKLCDTFNELSKHADGAGSDALADCYTVLLYTLLSEHFPSDANIFTYDSSAMQNFQMLLDYINLNYEKDISLQTLADKINYSVNYVSSLFKKYSSITFKEYLDRIRISHAAELIRISDTNHSFTEISARCGYENIRTFNNVFKRIMGCTPTDYKEGSAYYNLDQ